MTFLRSLLLLLLLAPSLSIAAAPNRLETNASITGVTVYQDRALTVRSATVSLKPGLHLITVKDLPVLLQDDSVRVEGKGAAGAVINSIEVRRHFLEHTAEKRVKEIDDEIRRLERSISQLDAKKAGITAQRGFLDSIRVSWSDRISKELAVRKPTSAELSEVISFIGGNVTRVEEQNRDIEQEKKLLKDKIDALKRQKNEATGSRQREVKVVEVLVEARQAGKLTLELSGVVSQASWEPAYDVRLSADGRTAELVYRAMVRQKTGEDWTNTALVLSTARPAAGGAPPELYPWRVSFQRPLPPPMARPAMAARSESRMVKSSAKMMAEMDESAGAAPEEAPAAFQTAAIETGTTSVSFRIPKPVDIAADGSKHSTVISVDRLPVATEYAAVPKLSPATYLTAELTNRLAFPLLPGEIRIFTGNTFTGSSTMKKTASGEKFTLPFGSDDQILVQREEQKQHKEAGIFGANRMSYQYKVTATNLRKEAQTVNIKDQLPLAENSEIKVSLDEAGLKPDERKDDGTVTWKLKLAPGEKKEFSFGITVEYPKERMIIGL